MTTDTKTKLQELLRGERDWDKLDMARECLEALEKAEVDGFRAGINEARDVYRILQRGA